MKPLAGMRIIDLTVAVAGPVATHILGDLGAEIIRVEPPFPRPTGHLDVAPRLPDAEDRPYNRVVGYNDLQRSKRGMTLDLSKPAGRDVLLQLVAISDAVVENMAPRVLPSLDLDYNALRGVSDDVVLVSMPAFGATGPLRDRVSFGPGIDAMSGLAHLTGYPDRGPMNASLYYCDYNAGALAALATVAALRHRDRTGEGQHVELAMIEGELQLLADALLDYEMNGRVQVRRGNAHPTMAPHGVYRCAGEDQWIAIACEDDAQWAALCDVLARGDEAAGDQPYGDVVSRVRHREMLDATINTWTESWNAHVLADALQAVGVPASAVQHVDDLLDDAQLAHRGWLQSVEHPEAGAIPHTRVAFTMARERVRIGTHAPVFGQDNDAVLGDLLGLAETEIAALAAEHVIAYEPPAVSRAAHASSWKNERD